MLMFPLAPVFCASIVRAEINTALVPPAEPMPVAALRIMVRLVSVPALRVIAPALALLMSALSSRVCATVTSAPIAMPPVLFQNLGSARWWD